LGGLALTHYRVLIIAVLFIAAYLILAVRSGRLGELIRKTFWVGAGAGLLFLPWFIHVFAGRIMRILAVKVSTPAVPASGAAPQFSALGDPLASLPAWMWLLLPLAIGWGLWRREKGAALVSLWWFISLLAANPQWLGLPGAGTIDGYTVMIATYFPASIILGASAGWLIQIFEKRISSPTYGNITGGESRKRWPDIAGGIAGIRNGQALLAVLLLLGVLGIGLYGARERIRDLHPVEFALVTRPDIRAAAWIQENIPAQARFLVNAFFAFNDTTVVGSDAGWWLPLLAKRSTTLPPINYAFEVHPQAGSEPLINTLTRKIQEKGLEDSEVLEWLKELEVTHIYIGQQQGRVNYTGPYGFDPQQLLKSHHFRLVYHEDRVWIFEIIS
jgi:hypothetical protein